MRKGVARWIRRGTLANRSKEGSAICGDLEPFAERLTSNAKGPGVFRGLFCFVLDQISSVFSCSQREKCDV